MTEPGIEIEAFFLADHAMAENGKLYANGAFWHLSNHPSFPAQTWLSFAFVIRGRLEEMLKDHTFSIQMLDERRETMDIGINGGFKVGTAPFVRPGETFVFPLGIPLGMAFPRPGHFTFELVVDDSVGATYEIDVKQTGAEPVAPQSESQYETAQGEAQ